MKMITSTQRTCKAIFLVLCLTLCSISAQNQPTRCETACSNDQSCRTNQCVLTRCSDTGWCYFRIFFEGQVSSSQV